MAAYAWDSQHTENNSHAFGCHTTAYIYIYNASNRYCLTTQCLTFLFNTLFCLFEIFGSFFGHIVFQKSSLRLSLQDSSRNETKINICKSSGSLLLYKNNGYSPRIRIEFLTNSIYPDYLRADFFLPSLSAGGVFDGSFFLPSLGAGRVFDGAFFLPFSGDEFFQNSARNAADLVADGHLESAFTTPSH